METDSDHLPVVAEIGWRELARAAIRALQSRYAEVFGDCSDHVRTEAAAGARRRHTCLRERRLDVGGVIIAVLTEGRSMHFNRQR